jgi:DinB superfamily
MVSYAKRAKYTWAGNATQRAEDLRRKIPAIVASRSGLSASNRLKTRQGSLMNRKTVIGLLAVCFAVQAGAQTAKPVTLRSILLEQIKTSHTEKDWFVPVNVAVEGVTPEQANWKDGSGNHSVGQLTYHLLFWNGRELARFTGKPVAKLSGNNDETFDKFDAKSWNDTVKQLDEVLAGLEKFVETTDDQTLQKYASEIAHIGMHNAYHVGQIIFVRKLQGSWNPEKGVK